MDDPRRARTAALGEWLREVAALVVVFPVIDQLVRSDAGARFDWGVALGSLGCGLLALSIGLYLAKAP